MADTHNQQEVKTRYPVTSGLTAGSTKQEGRQMNLKPEGLVHDTCPTHTHIRREFRKGIDH